MHSAALMLVFISQKIILNRTVHISDKSFSVTRDPSRAAKWYSWGNCIYSLHAYKHIHRQDRSSISLEPRCCWPQGLTERCVDSRRGVDMGKAERERGVKKKKTCLCVGTMQRGESWKPTTTSSSASFKSSQISNTGFGKWDCKHLWSHMLFHLQLV